MKLQQHTKTEMNVHGNRHIAYSGTETILTVITGKIYHN